MLGEKALFWQTCRDLLCAYFSTSLILPLFRFRMTFLNGSLMTKHLVHALRHWMQRAARHWHWQQTTRRITMATLTCSYCRFLYLGICANPYIPYGSLSALIAPFQLHCHFLNFCFSLSLSLSLKRLGVKLSTCMVNSMDLFQNPGPTTLWTIV